MGLKLTPPPSNGDNDRRRFDRMVHEALKELDKRTAIAGGPSSDTSARTLIAALASRVAALEAGGTSTTSQTMLTAAEAITKYNIVTADGYKADNGTPGHAGTIAGIALADISADGLFAVAQTGSVITNYSWSWSAGDILWCGASGALSSSSGTGSFAQPVGLAIGPTQIIVLIGDPVLSPSTGPFVKISASGILQGTDAGFSAFGLAFGAVTDAAWGRTALELGSAATSDTGDFATAAQGDLADSALQDAPSDGTGYVRKNGAWAAESGGGGGGSSLVGSATVTGSPATSLSVSGLDLDADGQYSIDISLKNATGSLSTTYMFYNGDATQTHYYGQFVSATGTSVAGGSQNDARIVTLQANATATIHANLLLDVNGLASATLQTNRGAPANITMQSGAHTRNVVENVSSITLTAAVANSLDVGSFLKVWKH